MRTLYALVAVMGVGLLAGCQPGSAEVGPEHYRPGTPSTWAVMRKSLGTPLLRGSVEPLRLEDFAQEIYIPESLPVGETAEPEPARAPARPVSTPNVSIAKAAAKHLEIYIVQRGDTLQKIGRRYAVTHGLLQRLNNMGSSDYMIHIGERLKVVRGPFRLVVDTRTMQLRAYLGETLVKTYPVGVGSNEDPSDRGNFRILDKVVKPRYDYAGMHAAPSDPNNPCGTRWIKIAKSYGIHGTNDPASIAKRTTRGCIRMYNADVEEVFDLIRVNGTVIVQ